MLFNKRERKIRRILVVEDEPLVAFDNEHLLTEAGYEIVGTVESFEEAAKLIAAESIDLVLTDIKLSGEGDGMDVARAAAARGVPVLFVTGNFPAEAQSLGAGSLAKPYTDKGLKAALVALESRFQGHKPKKLPAGLRFYDAA